REQEEHAEQAERALDEDHGEPRRRTALTEDVARDDAAYDVAGNRAGQIVVVEERHEVQAGRARHSRARERAPRGQARPPPLCAHDAVERAEGDRRHERTRRESRERLLHVVDVDQRSDVDDPRGGDEPPRKPTPAPPRASLFSHASYGSHAIVRNTWYKSK